LRGNDYVALELDFGAMPALTTLKIAVRLRTQDITPAHLETTVVVVLQNNELILEQGAVIAFLGLPRNLFPLAHLVSGPE